MAVAARSTLISILGTGLVLISCEGANSWTVEPWSKSSLLHPERVSTTQSDGGVPPALFARAVTSLPPHYREDLDELDAHLLQEQLAFHAGAPSEPRAHLCCCDYRDGPKFKKELQVAASREGGEVRSALNHFDGYCAIAHISSTTAATIASEVQEGARCSPLTHASKEPLTLVAPASMTPSGDGDNDETPFGLRLGPGIQEGIKRGLVVTMSPGSLPFGTSDASGGLEGSHGLDGHGGQNRYLRDASGGERYSPAQRLEERWRAVWRGARGRSGSGALTESVLWTSSSRGDTHGDGGSRHLLLDGPVDGSGGVEGDRVAPSFHQAKVAGYRAALTHLGTKMEYEDERGSSVASLCQACGWDNMTFEHARKDVLYLRGIHDGGHDEETATACFLALVGFLSSQPDVMHIHPEAKIVANNKVLTAYVEGGGEEETPMRDVGLDGSGEVIGVSDTGLDDNSCFFKDDENGMVPRTSVADAAYYPDQRKVVQYVEYADDLDEDGHGTHVAGIAAGAIYSGWEQPWQTQVSPERCEDVGLIRSCFGDCVEEMVADECHWNPELSCPMSGCDEDITCDDQTGYPFPCFDDPEEELPGASGMAPGAKLSFFDMGLPDGDLVLPNDLAQMWDAQRASGARIFSNSWSLVTQTEPTDRDVQLDEWLYSNPDSVVVFGAGNNGFSDGRFQSRTVQSPATSKTAVTVGCSNSGPDRAYAYYNSGSSSYDGVMSPSEDVDFEVSPYSARGPVLSFTAKPDVVAPGLMVHSAKASRSTYHEETCALESYGGTSMSAPAIAGAAALVRQYFRDGMLAGYLEDEGLCDDSTYNDAGLCEAFEPSGYLVKAILVNSAKWLGKMQTVSYDGKYQYMDVVDFAQGFGAVQLAAGLPTQASSVGAFFHDNSLESDARFYYSIYVDDPSEDLSSTVAWYDPPSSVASYNLLHDLDSFIMSVTTRTYYRSNYFNTIVALCGTDETCANKYEFTYRNNLADYMNTIERIVVPSEELEEGFYVICVRARVLTEADSQSYGLAVAGGGLELNDMNSNWNNLGLETQSVAGGDDESNGPEPDPDNLEDPSFTAAPTSSPLGSSSQTSPSPVTTPDQNPGAESVTMTTDAPTNPDVVPSGTADSSAGDVEDTDSGVNSGSAAAYPAVGGDTNAPDAGSGGSGSGTGSGRDVVGRDNDSSAQTTIVIAASVAGAAALIGLFTFIVLRRRKREHSTSRSLSPDVCVRPFISRAAAARISDGDSVMTVEDRPPPSSLDDVPSSHAPEHHLSMPSAPLPGYDTAVRISRQEEEELENMCMVRPESGAVVGGSGDSGEAGAPESQEVGPTDSSEMSAFYAAVDPSAVSKLVEWGIGRDFARVALRQTDNDIPAALRMVAQGDMDTRLALDLEEMASQAAAPEEVQAATEGKTAADPAEAPAQSY